MFSIHAVLDVLHTALSCAEGTAIHFSVGFGAVADDPAATVKACWREHVYGALEAVEGVHLVLDVDLEGLVIIVPAGFAACHG